MDKDIPELSRKDKQHMKKRITAVFLIAVLVSALAAGCKKNVGTPEDNAVTDEQEESQGEETQKVLGFSCSNLSNPFYTVLKEAVQASLEDEGIRLIVRDAKSDVNSQIEQVDELIDQKVEAVFLCPADREKITPALEKLNEAGIPVINLDTEVKESDLVKAFIGSDNRNAGLVCGKDLISRMPEGGRLVIVENSGINSINERITGFEEAVSNRGFEVVKRIDAGSESVETQMRTLLKDEQIDAVMCGNDVTALQVLQVLEQTKEKGILVYSVDGSPDIKSKLADPDSSVAGIGAQSPITMGKTAAKTAAAILNRDRYEKETYVETFFINRENIDMYGTDGWQ